ncbi:MAG: RICIN domain-containing protein [Thermodesulfobacteriota bacterium]
MPKLPLASILTLALVLAASWSPAAGPAQSGNCLESNLWPPMTDTMSLHPVKAPNKALDLAWPAPNAPTVLGLWSYHGGSNQRWTIYMGLSGKLPNSYMIKTTADRRCLVWSRPLPPLPERLHTVRCDGEDPAQRWCITGAGGGAVRIRNHQTGGCLSVDGNLAAEGAPAVLKPCDNSPEQRWLVR